MASLPTVSSLSAEGMLDAEGALDPERLISTLNQFIGGTYGALNRQLTFAGNFAATVKTIRLLVPDYPWREVDSTGNAAFENSWANYGSGNVTAAYRIQPGGVVELKGLVKSGTSAVVFTLPSGYRPGTTQRWAVEANDVFGYISITSGGAVTQSAGGNAHLSLDGVRFQATGTVAVPDIFSGNDWPQIVRHGLPRCTAVIPVACSMKDAVPGDSIGAYTIDWQDLGDGRLKIKAAYGLQPGRTYYATLMMFAE